jgi:predicted dehydrogenase
MGTGTIANDFVRVLRAVPDAEVAAIGSRTADRASLFADEHGVAEATIYGTYEELAADESIDIVYIATPSARHVSGAPSHQRETQALRASLHARR